jgi:hypothetical protein
VSEEEKELFLKTLREMIEAINAVSGMVNADADYHLYMAKGFIEEIEKGDVL